MCVYLGGPHYSISQVDLLSPPLPSFVCAQPPLCALLLWAFGFSSFHPTFGGYDVTTVALPANFFFDIQQFFPLDLFFIARVLGPRTDSLIREYGPGSVTPAAINKNNNFRSSSIPSIHIRFNHLERIQLYFSSSLSLSVAVRPGRFSSSHPSLLTPSPSRRARLRHPTQWSQKIFSRNAWRSFRIKL